MDFSVLVFKPLGAYCGDICSYFDISWYLAVSSRGSFFLLVIYNLILKTVTRLCTSGFTLRNIVLFRLHYRMVLVMKHTLILGATWMISCSRFTLPFSRVVDKFCLNIILFGFFGGHLSKLPWLCL